MSSRLKMFLKVMSVITIFGGIALFCVQNWLFTTWDSMSADGLIYHMKSSVEGTNSDMIKDALLKFALPGILVILALTIVLILIRNRKAAVKKTVFILYEIVGTVMLLYCCAHIETETKLFSYFFSSVFMKEDTKNDFIAQNYADPKNVKLAFPEQKRNLIYIFLESMEVTYTDPGNGGDFEPGCIPELTELAKENEDFSGSDPKLNGGLSLPGTNWTMGGMFAQSCGLPLQVPVFGPKLADMDGFFPTVTTLGDILQQEGYTQKLMLGSKAQFGGRDMYYLQHGNYELLDYSWAIETGKIPENYYVWWGYEDEKLFSFAREELLELSKGDEPFNLTMLTVDTHFPDGYLCPLCENEFGDNAYANVMACSSRQAAEFVRWIREQDFYENTTIILSGDHPTMDNDFCDEVDSGYSRHTYVAVINGAADTGNLEKRNYSTMDLFPTTLAAMGAKIEGDRLGLGTNLYSEKQTLLEEFGQELCEEKLNRPSAFMKKLSTP